MFRQTTYAMRRPCFSIGHTFTAETATEENKAAVAQLIQDTYHFALLQSTIEAAGGITHDTVEYSVAATSTDCANSIFTRDFAILIPDKNALLVPVSFLDVSGGR